jgi:hypothetical protein
MNFDHDAALFPMVYCGGVSLPQQIIGHAGAVTP